MQSTKTQSHVTKQKNQEVLCLSPSKWWKKAQFSKAVSVCTVCRVVHGADKNKNWLGDDDSK